MKKYFIGCGIVMLLSSCSYVDRSNNFNMDECDSNKIDVLIEKSGAETNDADNTPDISPTLSIPASIL